MKTLVTIDICRSRLAERSIEMLDQKFSTVHDKIHVRYPCGHDGWAKANNLFRGSKCLVCKNKTNKDRLKISTEDHRSRLNMLGVELLEEVKDTKTPVLLRFPCGHTARPTLNNVYGKNGTGCPRCKESKGEKLIAHALSGFNIKFNREQMAEGCRHNRSLRYDFYIPNLRTFIEFHGEQHYRFVESFHKTIKGFNESRKRDQIKKEWARRNNYRLIVIPFWIYDVRGYLFDRLSVQLSLFDH